MIGGGIAAVVMSGVMSGVMSDEDGTGSTTMPSGGCINDGCSRRQWETPSVWLAPAQTFVSTAVDISGMPTGGAFGGLYIIEDAFFRRGGGGGA